MHEFSEFDVKIPEFLVKLWKLVDDPETNDLIRWCPNGKAFVIVKPNDFTKELLPLNFKHGNMSSFNRQLNMYGFQKINNTLENHKIKDAMVFAHTCFIRGHPYLLENIKRKKATNKAAAPLFTFVRDEIANKEENEVKADILSQVLLDINNLKSKQSNWDNKLSNMKRENEALWKELAIFRQKHVKQEQIINKLIHFIVTMVRPSSRNVSIRRRYPLMINDVEGNEKTASHSSNPTIRELDPIEVFLADGTNSSNNDRTVPFINAIEQASNSKTKDGLTYFVSSPETETVEAEPQLTNWAQIEDYDEEAMTPINPKQACTITYDDTTASRPIPLLAPTQSTLNTLPLTSKIVASKGRKRAIPSGKEKSPKLKESPDISVSRSTNTSNIIQEALEMIDDSDLAIEAEESSQLDNAAPNVDSEFLRLLDDAVPSTSDNHTNTTIINPISIPESSDRLDSDTNSLAVVESKTGYHESDDVVRELSSHVDLVQGDIDILKELLKNENYSIDANTLFELFSEDPIKYVMPSASEVEPKKEGNEVMAYSSPYYGDLMEAYSLQPDSPCSSTYCKSPPNSPSVLETPVATPGTSSFIQSGTKRRKL